MNDTIGRPQSIAEQLEIVFHFVDGEKFSQELSMDDADAAESVMEWFRNPKGGPVWTWRHPNFSKVQMIPRAHVTFIEIRGYIDFDDGRDSRWYERLAYKIKAMRMTKRLKAGRS